MQPPQLRRRLAFWFAPLLCLAGCAVPVRLPLAAQQTLQAQLTGQTMALRQSCYFGNLYDENDLLLLSPDAPENSSHIVDLRGQPLHPPPAQGILPAGTELRVERLEFVSRWVLLRRMLKSPRFHPWVILHLAPPLAAQLGVPPPLRPFVLVLPLELQSEAEAQAAVAAVLAPPEPTQRWLAARRPTVQLAIATKKLLLGMSRDEMVAAMGEAPHQFVEAHGERQATVAWYSRQEAVLVDGAIVALRPPRPLAIEPRRP